MSATATEFAPITVALDPWEVRHATQVGWWRQQTNVGRRNAHGAPPTAGADLHVQGALAEYAVAKALNLFWSGVVADPFQLPGDVGTLQVRSTNLPKGRLIVHPRDPSDAVFLLVVSSNNGQTQDLVGWKLGTDAKSDDWWEDPTGSRPAFWVPRSELADPEFLRRG